MSIRVKILGSGSATPTHERNHSAQYLSFDHDTVLIDCGEGTQQQMIRMGIKPFKINYIFISHLHGDHYLGLVGLLSSLHNLGRTKVLTIYAPVGLREILSIQFKYSDTRLNYELVLHELQENKFHSLLQTSTLEVFAFPLKHRIPTWGFKLVEVHSVRNLIKEKVKEIESLADIALLKQGKNVLKEDQILYAVKDYCLPLKASASYAYCSDTMYDPEICPYVQGVDYLYHESTFLEDKVLRAKETFHTTAKQAAQIAVEAQVKHLAIGHFSSRYDDVSPFLQEAQTIFPSTVLATEGVELWIQAE